MSDAGRKMDVEDVLSSIRRLVSEEARSISDEVNNKIEAPEALKTAVEKQQPEPEAPEKLVLTTAFRVPNARLPRSSSTPDDPTENTYQSNIPPEPESSADSVIEPASDFEEPTPDAPFLAMETAEEPAPDSDSPFENPEEPIEFEPEIGLSDPDPIEEEPAPEAKFIEEPAQPIYQEPEPVMAGPQQVEPELAEPEPDIQAEPEVASYGYDDAVDYTAEDTYLDEEGLREMVSEMVRSELQGELGDRITRNVRKLVRREIHRALASRDFE